MPLSRAEATTTPFTWQQYALFQYRISHSKHVIRCAYGTFIQGTCRVLIPILWHAAGEDFVRNLGIKDLDFATIHVYPDAMGVPASAYMWVNENWIGDRTILAAASGKPLLFEVRVFICKWIVNRNML